MRILLVEDNANHRELMSLALNGHNPAWQLEEVASGEEALRSLAEGNAYDLMILDYSLPKRNGLEVLEQIRQCEAPPPVLMVTGHGDEQVAVEAMKAGAYDYVVKGKGYLQRLPVAARLVIEANQLAVERRRAEEELRKAYAQLKESQKILIESEKLAALGKFASGIAHEIRNPLCNISASAQFCLKKYKLNGQMKKHLNVILRNAEVANTIIKNLLDLAKPREFSFKLDHIGEVIDKACNLVKAKCSKERVRLYKRWPRRIPQLLLDEKLLEEAFLNIILNALDAMPNGGRLAITAYPDSQNNEVAISFLDTGNGIPQENLNKIFEPFFTTKEEGTGLGLYLAHQIISYHEGKVNIESKVGQGTEVVVRLPILRERE